MNDQPPEGFVPMKDRDGKVTGIMDQTTADYLASTAPDPTQQSIDTLLASVTRVRVIPFANRLRGTTEEKVLLDVSDPTSLASFRACFRIVEDPESFGHCMCYGDPHMELYAGSARVATLGYHHGFAIRWDAWRHDAYLQEPERLLDWMSTHGVTGPQQEVEAARQRAEVNQRNADRWLEAMPPCLRPMWEQMDHDRDPELHQRLLAALRDSLPQPEDQMLALFAWFGSGAGPWSGYPSYESVPNMLLLYYPTKQLLESLEAADLTPQHWLGAARYFASWDFCQTHKKDLCLLTSVHKNRFREAVQSTNIADNIARAARAYGP